MANPFPFVASTVLTAAQLNGIGEAWTSYTPVLKTAGNTVAATVSYAKYAQVNKIVICNVRLVATAVGSANGAISISLPVASTTSDDLQTIGSFAIKDASTAYYAGAAINFSTTTVTGIGYGAGGDMGASNPAFTIAVGDEIAFSVSYEVA